MAYIYLIQNNKNNKVYVGKTVQTIEKRWQIHLKDCKREKIKNRPLYLAMNFWGSTNFSIKQIEECSTEQLNEREIYWIKYYNSYEDGYNATIGGDGKSYIDYKLVVETYLKLKNMKETADLLKISRDTVSYILKNEKSTIFNSKEKFYKPVEMYFLNGDFKMSFQCISHAAKYLIENKLSGCKESTARQHISEVCRGKRKTFAKFLWKFVE